MTDTEDTIVSEKRTAAPKTGNVYRNTTGTKRSVQTSGARRPQQSRKRKKKKSSKAPIIIALLVIALIVFAVIKLTGGRDNANVQPQATEVPQTEQTENIDVNATPAPTIGAARIVKLDTSDLSPNTSLDGTWRSILLVGTDARLWDDMKHTDTMIIACYNEKTGAIRLISVMRDIFIDISEDVSGKGNVRLNTVSAYGGMKLLIKKLNDKLGLNIREYMLVDFAGFVEVVDILGGIEMDITEVEMQYINSSLTEQVNLLVDKPYREKTMRECTLTEAGQNIKLNGLQALAFARTRKSDNDYKRVERQRAVILAAAQKAIDTITIPQLVQVVNMALQYVETSISAADVVQLGLKVMNGGIGDIQSTRIPVNNTYKGETRKNVWGMYDMDWNANKQEVQSLLNGY